MMRGAQRESDVSWQQSGNPVCCHHSAPSPHDDQWDTACQCPLVLISPTMRLDSHITWLAAWRLMLVRFLTVCLLCLCRWEVWWEAATDGWQCIIDNWGMPDWHAAVMFGQLNHTIPYHTMPCHAMPYHTIPYHTTPHHTTPLHIIPQHNKPYYTTPCHITHHTIPCHTIPHHSIQHHTIPHHTTTHHTIAYHSTPYTTSHNTISHHISHHTIPHHTIPYHAIQHIIP